MSMTRFLLSAAVQATLIAGSADARESSPGHYDGYSALYQSIVKSSQYVDVGDGRLAVTVFRPANNAEPVTERLPTILFHYRFAPRSSTVDNYVKAGYVVVWIRQRGNGPSFGPQKGFVTDQNGQDVERVIDWARTQPWSNGKYAMAGGSHGGLIQWVTAQRGVADLLAITPSVTTARFYWTVYPNGVSSLNIPGQPGNTRAQPNLPTIASDPVDEDKPPYPLLQAAMTSQADNLDLPAEWLVNMHRDTLNPLFGYAPGLMAPAEHAPEIRASGVKVYNMAGWYDVGPGVQLLDHLEFGHKLIIGNWIHETDNPIQTVERLRWFDRWTKEIDNGVEREPPVYYETINAPEGEEWNFTASWPLVSQVTTRMYLGEGRSGTVASINDGTLSARVAPSEEVADRYRVDFSAGAFEGGLNRLNRRYGDITAVVAERALTYTTDILDNDMEITGYPVAHLWVTSTAPDGNFVIWIEDVDETGATTFVTDGTIRGSHRKAEPREPYDTLGIPYHPSHEADSLPLSQTDPAELAFEAIPTSYVFRKGHRIRISITGAAGDAYQEPPGIDRNNPPTISLYRGGSHASYIDLPVIPAGSKVFVGQAKSAPYDYDGEARLWMGRGSAFLQLGANWIQCREGDGTWNCGDRIGDVALTFGGEPRRAEVRGEALQFVSGG